MPTQPTEKTTCYGKEYNCPSAGQAVWGPLKEVLTKLAVETAHEYPDWYGAQVRDSIIRRINFEARTIDDQPCPVHSAISTFNRDAILAKLPEWLPAYGCKPREELIADLRVLENNVADAVTAYREKGPKLVELIKAEEARIAKVELKDLAALVA